MADIGISRRQRVFVVLEDTKGVLKSPTAANFIRTAGDAVMNQSPDFTNSEEKQNTLDILDQFQNATPAGEFSVPMYARPAGVLTKDVSNSVPQGIDLLTSFAGSVVTGTTGMKVSGSLTDVATTLTYKELNGRFPDSGIIKIGTELIYFASRTETSNTEGTLDGLVRGHGQSVAAEHLDNDEITLESIVLMPAQSSPSVSVYIETDHTVQAMSGCSPTTVSLSVANEGAVTFGITGNGMHMYLAGTVEVQNTATTGSNTVVVKNAKQYTEGVRIFNATTGDGKDSGYLIQSIDLDTNTLTLSTILTADWTADDTIKGWLPETGTLIGAPIESRHTGVKIGGIVSKFRSSEITFNVPKQFITDEVGTTFPEDYVEDVRDITMNVNNYFRKEDVAMFVDGFESNEQSIELTFGKDLGKQMVVTMPRNKLTVPTVNFEAPVVSLSIPARALGNNGEDSFSIRFE